jgi:hypothetical protein
MGGRRLTRAIAMLVVIGVAVAVPQAGAMAGGRGRPARVLPPSATPLGYSREEMTGLLALFTTSGNQTNYPDTPFQILFTDPARTQLVVETRSGVRCEQPPAPPGPGCGWSFLDNGGVANHFEVSADQPFFVPVDNADDSPTIAGDFPTTERGAKRYVFDHRQLGGRDFAVIIDGRRTSLGPAYVAGPVETAPLFDGGGTHMITIGAFIGPMSPGTHTVRITGGYYGDAIEDTYGLAFIRLDFTYEVVVTDA